MSMTIWRVTYWDPCNGMGGTTQGRGYFLTERLADLYIAPRAKGWDVNAYSKTEITVVTESDHLTVLDELKEYMP